MYLDYVFLLISDIRVRYQIRTVDSKPLGFFDFNVITDYVTDLAKYGRNKTETLVFEVKICLQAKLFMSNSEVMSDSTLRYEVLIGGWGNAISAIRRSDGIETNDVSEKFNTAGLLDCNQYRLLWASWEDGTIKLGTGGIIGDNLQCSWTDPNPFEVRSAGIYSRNNDGEWIIEIDGKYITLKDIFRVQCISVKNFDFSEHLSRV